MATRGLPRMLVYWVILNCLAAVVNGVPPELLNLDDEITIGENEDTNRPIFTLNVRDEDGDTFTCDNTITGVGGTPVGDEFTFTKNTKTKDYELDITPPAAGYDPAITYHNVIRCGDGQQTSTGTLIVKIKPDQDYWWDTLPSTVNKKVFTVGVSGLIDTAAADNTLNDPMTYNISKVTPDLPGDKPYFQIDPATGRITTTQELWRIDSRFPSVEIYVTATDGTAELTEKVTLQMTGQNVRSEVQGVPAVQKELESIAPGTTLFTATCNDPDLGQTLTIKWNCDPTIMEDTFYLDTFTNEFKINESKSLNYEGVREINCTFICNDEYHDSDPFSYLLKVQDVNEAPQFDQTTYYAELTEAPAKSVSVDPGAVCTDEDSDNDYEPLTYSFEPFNRSELLDVNSDGVITFATNYDIDPPSDHPSQLDLSLLCCDDGDVLNDKLCATAQVIITVHDANDNDPEFPSPTYTMYANTGMTPSVSVIGLMPPNDKDNGTNGEWTCTEATTSGNGDVYDVESDCTVRFSKTPPFEPETTVTYLVTAVDKGDPQRTGTATLNVVLVEATTTTTTTTQSTATSYNFFSQPENIAFTVLGTLAGLALLGCGLYFLLRCCCSGMCGGGGFCDCASIGKCTCRKSPPRQVTPVTPPREKTPIIREKPPPPRIVARPTMVKVVKTVSRPAVGYSAWRTAAVRPQVVRTAPTLRTAPSLLSVPPPYMP